MSVSCGFYNALEHDRLYDAIQMSSLFDGIIRDGVFSTIGDALMVNAPGDGLYVVVKSGRAWFNHSWTLNDTEYPISFDEAELVQDRIDAVVLEVNSSVEVRDNTLKIIKGTPSTRPVKPELTHTTEVNQYALAYVTVKAGATIITQANVENAVGTDETPFVTGVLQQISIEDIILQWETEFNEHFAEFVATNEAAYLTWSSEMQAQYNAWMTAKMNQYSTWFAQMQSDMDDDFAIFDAWFQSMKDQLSTDAAGHLQAEIDALALQAAKGSEVTVTTINSSLFNRTVIITQGSDSVSASFDANGVAVFDNVPYIGTVTISATDGIQTATTYLNIPYFGRYSAQIAFWAAVVNISTLSPEFFGLNISVSKGDVIIDTIAFDNVTGRAMYTAIEPGTYKFVVVYEGNNFDASVDVTAETTYNLYINDWTAELQIESATIELYSRTITITKGGVIVGTTTFDNTGHATYKVHSAGTYVVSATDTLGETYTEIVEVIEETAYPISLGIPNGKVATPTDDIQIWLKCAGILDKDYATMDEVLADLETLETLLGDSNACDYMARSTTWALTESIVPIMTSNTAPRGTASAIDQYSADYAAWKAFDGNDSTSWISSTALSGSGTSGKWIGYSPVEAVAVRGYYVKFDDTAIEYCVHKLQGSNDGTNWTDIGQPSKVLDGYNVVENETAYARYRLYINTQAKNKNDDTNWNAGRVKTLQFYSHIGQFVASLDAMTRLGKYDYACDALLRNSIWNDAINESVYRDYIITDSIPVMTSATTPSGEVSSSSEYGGSTGYANWKAFDNSATGGWIPQQNDNPPWLQYKFPQPMCIERLTTKGCNGTTSVVWSTELWGSNDGTDWTVIDTNVKVTWGNTTKTYQVSNNSFYLYYRLVITATTSGWTPGVGMNLQMYGRHAASETGQIHSAPADTIYYIEDGEPVTLCVTDANGVGEVDWEDLPVGDITLYSSVAKDPSDLSKDYSKTIKVTPKKYDAYLMPEGVIYWYGWYLNNWTDTNFAELHNSDQKGYTSTTKNTNSFSTYFSYNGTARSTYFSDKPFDASPYSKFKTHFLSCSRSGSYSSGDIGFANRRGNKFCFYDGTTPWDYYGSYVIGVNNETPTNSVLSQDLHINDFNGHPYPYPHVGILTHPSGSVTVQVAAIWCE